MPVERLWVTSLPHRFQQTMWRGRMYMPDALVSQVVLDDDRLLSVEAQYVSEGFARRLRCVERRLTDGRVTREWVLPWDVPEGHETCRLVRIAGRWYVGHRRWEDAPTPDGILTPWPGPAETNVPRDLVRANLLPDEMARDLDAGGFGTDGLRLVVANITTVRTPSDARRWLVAAAVDIAQPRAVWAARVPVPFRVERHRGGVRVGRFGPVVIVRSATIMPAGQQRCRELIAAFDPDTGRALWSRPGPPRRQPPAFDLVGDGRNIYVHAEDTTIEAWQLLTGRTVRRWDLGRPVVADAVIDGEDLVTFVGDDYPAPGSPGMVQPVTVPIGTPGEPRFLRGEARAVCAPSFTVQNRWVVCALDDRLIAWSLSGEGQAMAWTCWTLPGGLVPQDAAGEAFRLNGSHVAIYTRGTGTLTVFRTATGM